MTQIEVVLTAILAQKVTNGYLSRQILGPVSHRLGHHAQPLVPQIAMLESNSPMTSDIGKDRKGGHCMHPRVEKGTFCKHELSTPQTPKHSWRSCTRWWCVGSNWCRPGRSLPGERGKTSKPRLLWVMSDIWSLRSSHHPRRTGPKTHLKQSFQRKSGPTSDILFLKIRPRDRYIELRCQAPPR